MKVHEFMKQRKIKMCHALVDIQDGYNEMCDFACLFDEQVEGGMPEVKKFIEAFHELQTLLNIDLYSFRRQKNTPQ